MESEDDNFHDFQAESQGFQLPALHFCWNFGINYIYIYFGSGAEHPVPRLAILSPSNTTFAFDQYYSQLHTQEDEEEAEEEEAEEVEEEEAEEEEEMGPRSKI